MTGSGANLEALRIPLNAVATNPGLTSWVRERDMKEDYVVYREDGSRKIRRVEGEMERGRDVFPIKFRFIICSDTHTHLYNDSL